MKAFCSWSGGKDSAFSLYLSKRSGIECVYLLTMLEESGLYSRSHGFPKELILAQSRSLKIPILTMGTSWDGYEKKFREALSFFKTIGIKSGIFGDIDLEEHRIWVERVTNEEGITPILPLWKMDEARILSDFLAAGFKAIICCTRVEELLEHLGEDLSLSFFTKLRGLGLDPLGENGEYHTFVYDGPIFEHRIEFEIVGRRMKEKMHFLDLRLKE